MVTKSTKIALSTLIGVIFLAAVLTVGCKDKKKAEEAAPAAPTEVKTETVTPADTIPVIDTGGSKELEPPKPKN